MSPDSLSPTLALVALLTLAAACRRSGCGRRPRTAGGSPSTTARRRRAGSSWRPPRGLFGSFTVDDHIRLDAPALIRLALERTGAQRAFWVGHSLGGLVGYAAAQGP